MQILVSGRGIPNRTGWSNAECLARGFKALGHDVQVYGNVYQTDDRIEQLRWKIADADLIVYTECNDADPQYAELFRFDVPTVYWEFDTAMHEDFSRFMWPHFDKVYCANPNYRRETTFLPYGVDETLFYPGKQVNGAAIVGTPFKKREEFAAKAQVDIVSGLYGADYAAFIRTLRVHVHAFDSGGRDLLVSRVWETLASGVVLLTKDNLSIRRHFTPGVHLEVYDDPWDCRKRLDALLRDDERRGNIARNGYNELLRRHTWTCRARRILADMGAR